jgi:hypothetical protein
MFDCYGAPTKPKYHDNIERHKKPESLQKLDQDSSKLLAQYLRSANDGLLMPRVTHQTIVILWLIDEAGDCWYCIEEMYKSDSEISVFPRLDEVDYPKGYEKLGHPSLISAKRARIAGEIIWSGLSLSEGKWLISNKSGRYGIRPDITEEHLISAKELFQSHGVEVDHYYIPHQD